MKVQSRQKSKYWQQVKLGLIALAIVVLGWLLPAAVSFVSQVLFYPVHVTSVWLKESNAFIPVLVRDRKSLESEIQNLKTEIEVVGHSELTQRRLRDENNRLRALLGAEEETRIAAAVVARPTDLPYDLLQIDQGANKGIQIGAPVFIGPDVVIGLVTHVAEDYSFVRLTTAPGFSASAFIAGPNVAVKLEGLGGGVARVKVPQGVALQEGNVVYLPSITPGVFGRISLVENEPTQPEQFGYIIPDISITSIFHVSVGRQTQVTRSATVVDKNIVDIINQQLVVEGISVATSTDIEITNATSTEDVVLDEASDTIN